MRVLMLKGPTGYGKSKLVLAARDYAKPTAYVDFKEQKNLDKSNVLEKLLHHLGVVLPAVAAATKPNSSGLLEALGELTGPALILFDTYEKVIESKDFAWIKDELLAKVATGKKCQLLQLLIAGQKVPPAPPWSKFANEIELDRMKDQRAWQEWIRKINPNVGDELVERAVAAYDGNPKEISSFLKLAAEKLTPAG